MICCDKTKQDCYTFLNLKRKCYHLYQLLDALWMLHVLTMFKLKMTHVTYVPPLCSKFNSKPFLTDDQEYFGKCIPATHRGED